MTLPQAAQDLIGLYIDSIETLDILLLLHRSPDTFWTPSAIDSHFGMRKGTAEKRLQGLDRNGLATKGMSGGYRYAAKDEALRAAVSALAVVYADQRSAVINRVLKANVARLQAFSDAFRMKPE